VQNPWITTAASFFAFFAIVTSFLGVTLSLSDFLTDGLKIKKTWEGKLLAWGLTFIPPLVFVFTYQRGFFLALGYAGVFVAVLLILLPAMMAWQLKTAFYRSIRGRVLMAAVMILAIIVIGISLLDRTGVLRPLIDAYVST
jgi:tyrosine-specific transport protein